MNKVLLVWLLFVSIHARAQTWNGTVSSSWNTAANWTPANVPTSSSAVTINSAATPFKPTLQNNVSIASLNMTAGKLDLAGFTLMCSGTATLDGDSLTGGKIVANNIGNFADNRVVGKLTLQKTSATGTEYFYGNNKVYADSLIVLWGGGTLHFDYAGAPDTVFGTLAITTSGAGTMILGGGTALRVDGSLVINNAGNSTYNLGGGLTKSIGGSMVWVGGKAPTLTLENVRSNGAGVNGPFVCADASIQSSSFAGSFSLTADSNQNATVLNSSFLGASNSLQAGVFGNFQNNVFNSGLAGATMLTVANNTAVGYTSYTGGNKVRGSLLLAASTRPGSGTQNLQWGYYGVDSVFGAVTFRLMANANLVVGNSGGAQYVGGDLTLDADGAGHNITFSPSSTHRIGGSFLAQNFLVNTGTFSLANVTAAGTAPTGTIRCFTGNISGCSFGGDFTLTADSSQGFDLTSSQFLGANNFFRAGEFYTLTNNVFGQVSTGTTTHIAANNTAVGKNCFLGGNKVRNNWLLAGAATGTGSSAMGLFSGYYSADSCFGTATISLGAATNLSAATSGGTQYVAGNLVLDGTGTSHSIVFSSSGAHRIGGSLVAQNFSANTGPLSLYNTASAGTGANGPFVCGTGLINTCSFAGDVTVLVDSAQNFDLLSSQFLGANNFFRAGEFYTMTNNVFGQVGTGLTTHILANNTTSGKNTYLGNNRIRNNWVLHAAPRAGAGTVTLHPNYYGADTCGGNATWKFSNASALNADMAGDTAYTAGNLILDLDGGSHSILFSSSGAHFVGGALQMQNGAANTATLTLNKIRSFGTAANGPFVCGTGLIDNSLFSGNFSLAADSAQNFDVTSAQFLGANNTLRAGQMYTFTNNVFGQAGVGTTSIITAGKGTTGFTSYDGNNRYRGALTRVLFAPVGGSQGWFQSYYAADSVGGAFTLQCTGVSNANLANQTAAFFGGSISISNVGTGTVQSTAGSPLTMYGTDTATFSYTGTEPILRRVRMNKVGGLRLLSPLRIPGNVTLDTGVILTTTAVMLTVLDGATATGLQRRSFVDGPMKKIGNGAFSFPVGDSIFCAPIGITAPAAATDEFVARYYRIPPHTAGYDTSNKGPGIVRLSAQEYWTLEHTAGTLGVKVTLSHDTARSGLITNQASLLVAHWKGAPPSWQSEGAGATTGNIYAGTVQSANTVSTFSPFTLGSSSAGTPLPATGLDFSAEAQGTAAHLTWKARSEIGAARYDVERSANGDRYEQIGTVKAGGDGTDYVHRDVEPMAGRNLYRIAVIGEDGSVAYSVVRSLTFTADGAVRIFPSPAGEYLWVEAPAAATATVYAADGRMVLRGDAPGRLAIGGLRGGVYFIRVLDAQGELLVMERFVKE